MKFQILFQHDQPISCKNITKAIHAFGSSYTVNVRKIIATTETLSLDKNFFMGNAARLLNNFKMTRQGPFKGLRVGDDGQLLGPVAKLNACWEAVGNDLIRLKQFLKDLGLSPRSRTILLMTDEQLQRAIEITWSAFKKLLPITMGKTSYGLVGASKILFSIFPEIVLPIDNAEWKYLFKTVDLGDVIRLMAREIREWENRMGQTLDSCEDQGVVSTLPAIYNVMAMKARP